MDLSSWAWPAAGVTAGGLAAGGLALREICRRNMHLWLPGYLASRLTSPRRRHGAHCETPLDVFIAVCDHYEPEWGHPGKRTSLGRVERWHTEYPRLFERFHDSDGRPPQHSYFFPAEEYAPEYLDLLTDLHERGLGDVEIHLHHDNDTPDGLRGTLTDFKHLLHEQHGLLRRDPETGHIVYGFIHGNWALCNSRPDGRWCGVDHELPILLETGCYADFTMPSAPSNTQTRTINSIYYASDAPGRKSHDVGMRAAVGRTPPPDSLLMIQGPLVPNWTERKAGIIPRIENGDLHANQPPTWLRLQNWLKAGVCVEGKPDWLFVKLHTHGAQEANMNMWLGDKVQEFHADLARHAEANPNFRYHYVTAWEMAQRVHAAEAVAQSPSQPAVVASF